jgi:Uma2 family endonuclease
MAGMAPVTSYQVEDWFTADDLDTMPDDGNRYELLDNEILVSPSPRVMHQAVQLQLALLLARSLPSGLRLLTAPMDVRFGPKRQLQPDLLVIQDEGLEAVRVERVPLLVVEILSRGTRGRDLIKKRRVYEQEGVASYWVIDPAVPSLLALELVDGAYVEVARVEGAQSWTAERPYAVTVVPAHLLR